MTYEEWYQSFVEKTDSNFKMDSFLSANGSHFQNVSRGEPVFIKKIDFSNEASIMKEIKTAQMSFANLPYEVNLTVTSDGKMWLVKGDAATVNPWKIQEMGSALAGSFSYHNHPPRETHYSFSAEDVRFFFDSKEKYSRASDDIFEYVMQRNEKTVDIPGEIVYHKFKEIYNSEISELAYYEQARY